MGEDITLFKDSDRESIISYLSNQNLVDTPTRLVNFSNEFLPKKKKLNTDKLKQKDIDISNIKNFTDLEKLSDVENS